MSMSRGLVPVALLIGLALRVAGLGWGLPAAGRGYPYHPDEPVVALATLRIDFGALQLSPRMFNYGSLSLYLDRLAINLVAAMGGVDLAPTAPSPAAGRTVGAVIRIGRWLTVVMGVLTVAVVAGLGARLYGPAAGGLAALLLALAPLHLAHGHYNTVDVPATFWTTLCLLLCAGALRRPGRAALATAGACAGLAASTKYNAGLVVLAPLYVLAATWRRPTWCPLDRAAALVYTLLAAAAVFLLTTPGIFLDPVQFWHDFRFELWHSSTGHGLVFEHTSPAWLYHLTRSLPDGLGVPLALVAMAGVVCALFRHRVEEGLLLSFLLPYFMVIGSAEVKFSRYLLPILPPLLLLAARLLVSTSAGRDDQHGDRETRRDGSLVDSTAPASHWGEAPAGIVRGVALAIVVVWTGVYGAAMAATFVRPDPRDQAATWVNEQRREGERVALGGDPWFYTPPLTASLGCTKYLAGVCGAPAPAWIVAPRQGALSLTELDGSRAAFVVVSEFEFGDPLRLRAETGYTDGTTALLDHLAGRFVLARTFRNRPRLGPFGWFQRAAPVHDLLYPMPDVRVYHRIE